MRKLLFLFIVGCIISLSSCREDFKFEASTGGLEFSKDTVYLDTVFTNIGSSTYRLKVYNRSDKDISIPKIQLQKGVDSKYRMMVDGMTGDAGAQGKIFSNVELLAKDSLFIFIEVTSDVASANPTDFLYTDQIQFTNVTGAPQTVELVTLIQDAYFIYPNRTQNPDLSYRFEQIIFGVDKNGEQVSIDGSVLDHNDPINGDEYVWGNDKPYVVYGYAFVPDNEELVVKPGARIHFHDGSGLIIGRYGKLTINGGNPAIPGDKTDLSNEVIFEGDRLEYDYNNVPGQWSAIINYSVRDNTINHLTLKNAVVGILSTALFDGDVTKLTITNSQIYDCSNIGILARNANITGNNLVINNAGQATLACTYGGMYNFTHCTFNNNWSSSNQRSVLLNNFIEVDDVPYVQDLNEANFTNCIIYGSNQIELIIEKKEDQADPVVFNYNFKNCLIKFNNVNNQFSNNPFYDFTDSSIYENCSIALNANQFRPRFENIAENKLWLTELINLPADETTAGTLDIKGITRTIPIDLGAYQYVP